MKLLNSLLLIASFSFCKTTTAQEIEKYFESKQPVSYEKLYLHVDREFYFLRDTIWFNAYLLDGQGHTPIAGKSNLHVELINRDGGIASSLLFLIDNGTVGGYIPLVDTAVVEGNYLLRAYTNYLKNFGGDAFFTKTIKVSKIKNSIDLYEGKKRGLVEKDSIDLQLLPEGGFLLPGVMNRVGIKALGANGKGIDVKGELLDSGGKVVLSFETTYKGMGVFFFIPEEGETYSANIESFPCGKVILDDIRASGAKLFKVSQGPQSLNLSIVSNDTLINNTYYLACLNRGRVYLYVKVEKERLNRIIKIGSDKLKQGINRIVLLDDDLKPISERLVFSDNYTTNELKLTLNQDNYSTREEVKLNIASPGLTGLNDYSRLSVAVIDKNSLNAEGTPQNILSYLLLDSELKGDIESPNDFFKDGEEISSRAKLDLLMLTNGWSNYLWNHLEESNKKSGYEHQAGIK